MSERASAGSRGLSNSLAEASVNAWPTAPARTWARATPALATTIAPSWRTPLILVAISARRSVTGPPRPHRGRVLHQLAGAPRQQFHQFGLVRLRKGSTAIASLRR